MLDNKFDFIILNYIAINGKSYESEILTQYPDDDFATKGRLKSLRDKKLIDRFPKMTTINHNPPTFYVITSLGKKIVQDYLFTIQENRKITVNQWIFEMIRSIFCPIIVAILTSMIMNRFFN